MGIDIEILETFIQVSELHSFSKAARKLCLSQPAVSLQIKALEKELGATLIERGGGKITLTPAGITAYEHAKKIIAGKNAMMADIPRTKGEVSGRLRVGASTIPGEYLLIPVLRNFLRKYQKVSVSLDIRDSGNIIKSLLNEEIELGFIGYRSEHHEIAELNFASDSLVLITPPSSPLSRKQKIRLADLFEERMITRITSSGTRITFEKALAKRGSSIEDLNVVAELGSTQAVLQAVQAGLGISVVSKRAASQPAKFGLIGLKKITDVDLSRNFYIIHLKDKPLTLVASKFLERCTPADHEKA